MTGEITLRGEVLPIGGLKEKLLAAHRGGIETVLIPADNEKDLAEIPKNIKDKLNIVPVKWIDEVFELALQQTPRPIRSEVASDARKRHRGRRRRNERSDAASLTRTRLVDTRKSRGIRWPLFRVGGLIFETKLPGVDAAFPHVW